MKKGLLFTFIVLFCFIPVFSQAAQLKSSYPRLANYYLKWELNSTEARELAKWDLLILDMEVGSNSPDAIKLIREINPQVIILAYITSQEIIEDINQAAGNTGAFLRRELKSNIVDSWWLRDQSGQRISFWPGTYMLNLSDGAGLNSQGQRFNDYLPEFVAQKIASLNLFDGVYYDNTWGDVSWVNNGNVDVNNDRVKDNSSVADTAWSSGFLKMLKKTRTLLGDKFIIVGNGRIYQGYQNLLNGMMLESFPSEWENGGHWTGSMQTYLRLPTLNVNPQISIINVNKKNQYNYPAFRFGLTSTLLGNGFYSYDYDVSNHTQTWWYDEYNVNLGPAQSQAYNLLQPSAANILQPGLWRRDFKYGSVLVNSTIKEQLYVFNKENFEKIKGTQDKIINNGATVNFINLAAQDGIVLLKINENIYNTPFVNGYFYRVYNSQGAQTRKGFFAFSSAYPAGESVAEADGSKRELEHVALFSNKGHVKLHKNGKEISSFSAYNNLFTKPLNLATKINDGFFEIVVTGTTNGGGPQVRAFSATGKLISSFFAYNEKLRTGVSVALGDVDGDGNLEIVTGPGRGEKPLVKIFSLTGEFKNSFLAYNDQFYGGVEVAVADLDNNGYSEIITGPGPGGGPQVRIFNSAGRPLSQFFAYDQNYRGGLKLSVSDLDSDGQLEILVGLKNF